MFALIVLLYPLLVGIISLTTCTQDVQVNTKYGKIIGLKKINKNDEVTVFLGVPYAKPPVKDRRFKPPSQLDKDIWKKKPFKATQLANSCPQLLQKTGLLGYDILVPDNTVSEDCLQLNIWVPKEKNVPVLVFFHGGAYNFGSGSLQLHNGTFIAIKTNQIVVNVNYRLGFLGFAYMGNGKTIPGNMGLLDQQMALKWIYENIASFGGDPTRITIWGQSSGSASATAHLYAPDSHKYFSKVIASSGTISNVWASIGNSFAENNTRTVANLLKCKGKDSAILKCLQEADVNSLVKLSLSVRQPNQNLVFYSFAPVDKDDNFFKGSIQQKVFFRQMKTDADLLIGKTSSEGTYFMPSLFGNERYKCYLIPNVPLESEINSCNMNQSSIIEIIGFYLSPFLTKPEDLKPIINEYLKLQLPKPRDTVARFISDVLFDCGIIQFADSYATVTKKNIYFYHFTKQSYIRMFPLWMSKYHGIDLEFQFNVPLLDPSRYKTYKELRRSRIYARRVNKMFVEFNLKSNPGRLWKKYDLKRTLAGILDHKFTLKGPKRFMNVTTDTCTALTKLIIKSYIAKNKVIT
uniref:Carboxylic ester hydrolase n=1 Tax=Strongyloides papillosus TaxID=174720 RepID=A0A0N5BJ67_STREA